MQATDILFFFLMVPNIFYWRYTIINGTGYTGLHYISYYVTRLFICIVTSFMCNKPLLAWVQGKMEKWAWHG